MVDVEGGGIHGDARIDEPKEGRPGDTAAYELDGRERDDPVAALIGDRLRFAHGLPDTRPRPHLDCSIGLAAQALAREARGLDGLVLEVHEWYRARRATPGGLVEGPSSEGRVPREGLDQGYVIVDRHGGLHQPPQIASELTVQAAEVHQPQRDGQGRLTLPRGRARSR